MLEVLAVISFAVAFAAVRVLISRFGRVALDRPNPRSLHQHPVPRTGGLAVLLGALTSLAFGAAALGVPVTVALCLAALSFADDLYGVPSALRLLGHLAAAAVLVWYVLTPMQPLELVLIGLGVAWITNVYNFMDGTDGLAGGMSVIGFGAYALAAVSQGDASMAALSLALAASALAFLIHNFHPARIFLGDVGSIPLGFLAGALGIIGWRNDLWPLWFPVLVFGPFIADSTVTLIRRLLRGERIWQAHREHYYQRMVRLGAGHRRTALILYALMLVCAAAALYGRTQPPLLQAAAFACASAFLAVAAIAVDWLWLRHERTQGRSS